MPRRSSKGNSRNLPALHIDFSRSMEDILSTSFKARVLGWSKEQIVQVEGRVGLWDRFPMTCRGAQCPFAARCPVSHRSEFIGTPCIVEQVEAYRLFVAYVRELEVSPDDHVDLQMISELVRLHLMQRRLELTLAEEDVTEEVNTVVGGRVVTNREVNKLMSELRNIRNDILKLYDKLLASREARLKKRVAEERLEKDAASVFARLSDRLQQATQVDYWIVDTPKALPEVENEQETADGS